MSSLQFSQNRFWGLYGIFAPSYLLICNCFRIRAWFEMAVFYKISKFWSQNLCFISVSVLGMLIYFFSDKDINIFFHTAAMETYINIRQYLTFSESSKGYCCRFPVTAVGLLLYSKGFICKLWCPPIELDIHPMTCKWITPPQKLAACLPAIFFSPWFHFDQYWQILSLTKSYLLWTCIIIQLNLWYFYSPLYKS